MLNAHIDETLQNIEKILGEVMTAKEIQEARTELERSITGLLQDFELRSGMGVSEVVLHSSSSIGGVVQLHSVRLKVVLP